MNIQRVDDNRPINDNRAVCSTTFTGFSSKMVNRLNYPGDLTIESIEDKFDNRFVNGIFVNIVSGDINGGTSLN